MRCGRRRLTMRGKQKRQSMQHERDAMKLPYLGAFVSWRALCFALATSRPKVEVSNIMWGRSRRLSNLSKHYTGNRSSLVQGEHGRRGSSLSPCCLLNKFPWLTRTRTLSRCSRLNASNSGHRFVSNKHPALAAAASSP